MIPKVSLLAWALASVASRFWHHGILLDPTFISVLPAHCLAWTTTTRLYREQFENSGVKNRKIPAVPILFPLKPAHNVGFVA